MGYRSDVRIITSKKGFKELKKYYDNYLKQHNFEYTGLLDSIEINKETKDIKYFGWDYVKWYDYINGYDDVTAIMEGLNHLRNEGYAFRYARIGEKYDDYGEDLNDSITDIDLPYIQMIRKFEDEVE